MTDLSIQANRKTPFVDFRTSGELLITGRSLPENAFEFYNPIIQWIKNFKETHPPKVTLTVNLEYYNTSTSKMLLNIIQIIESIQENGDSDVTIIWQYHTEDEEMCEAGCYFQHIVKTRFLLSPFETIEPLLIIN